MWELWELLNHYKLRIHETNCMVDIIIVHIDLIKETKSQEHVEFVVVGAL